MVSPALGDRRPRVMLGLEGLLSLFLASLFEFVVVLECLRRATAFFGQSARRLKPTNSLKSLLPLLHLCFQGVSLLPFLCLAWVFPSCCPCRLCPLLWLGLLCHLEWIFHPVSVSGILVHD